MVDWSEHVDYALLRKTAKSSREPATDRQTFQIEDQQLSCVTATAMTHDSPPLKRGSPSWIKGACGSPSAVEGPFLTPPVEPALSTLRSSPANASRVWAAPSPPPPPQLATDEATLMSEIYSSMAWNETGRLLLFPGSPAAARGTRVSSRSELPKRRAGPATRQPADIGSSLPRSDRHARAATGLMSLPDSADDGAIVDPDSVSLTYSRMLSPPALRRVLKRHAQRGILGDYPSSSRRSR